MRDEELLMLGQPLKDLDGPVFDHPWQAQAFALVVSMHKAGLFQWKDWAETFTAEIASAPAKPGENVNDTYYRQWLAALEKIVKSLDFVDGADISSRADEWRQAYLNTPHGLAVSLAHAKCPPAHEHKHEPKRSPVKVVPATVEPSL